MRKRFEPGVREGGIPPSWGDRSEAKARGGRICRISCWPITAETSRVRRKKEWPKWKNGALGSKGLATTIVNPGTPLPVSKVVTSDRVEDDNDPNSMKGFAVVKARSMEAAVEIAQSDPVFGKRRDHTCVADDGDDRTGLMLTVILKRTKEQERPPRVIDLHLDFIH